MLTLKWSLRQQILAPLVLTGILFIFWFADRVTARRQSGMDATEDSSVRVIAQTLSKVGVDDLANRFSSIRTDYPGWELVAFQDDQIVADSIQISESDQEFVRKLPACSSQVASRNFCMPVDIAGSGTTKPWYWITKIRGEDRLSGTDLALFYSIDYAQSLDALVDRQDEMMAFALTVALIIIAIWFSSRLTRRITQIQRKVREIANGDLSTRVNDLGKDEISDLARSVDQMAADLSQMKRQVELAERIRLHEHVGRGIAHELRNGIHTARLALEMYRDGDNEAPSPLLNISYEQLCLMEFQVRRLLTGAQQSQRNRVSRPLGDVFQNAMNLIDPIFKHAEVTLSVEIDDCFGSLICDDSESIQSAIINLCMNAVEATGRHGHTQVHAFSDGEQSEITISDSGPGPSASVADSLFAPFVSTKPEGVGLGLVQVKEAVTTAGGNVGWSRQNATTVFWIRLPHLRTSGLLESSLEVAATTSPACATVASDFVHL